MSTETTRLIRDGVWRWEKREINNPSLHCQHQNDSCIKMGSDESHFNVSVGNDGQSHKTVSQTTTFLKRKENRSGIEPRSFGLPALRVTARPNRLTSTRDTTVLPEVCLGLHLELILPRLSLLKTLHCPVLRDMPPAAPPPSTLRSRNSSHKTSLTH